MNIEVIEKITKLLALTSSSNEHEAANAMRLAQKLMLQYDLSEEELKLPKEEIVKEYLTFENQNYRWRLLIWNACSKMYMCRIVRYGYDNMYVIGRPHHTKICKSMIYYLERALEDNLKKVKKIDKTIEPAGYRLGWCQAVYDRVILFGKEETSDVTALVVREDAAVAEFCKDFDKGGPLKNQTFSRRSFNEGMKDGEKVSLNTQIGAK